MMEHNTTIVVSMGKFDDRVELFVPSIGLENIIETPATRKPTNDIYQDDRSSDEVEQALAPIVTALRVMPKISTTIGV